MALEKIFFDGKCQFLLLHFDNIYFVAHWKQLIRRDTFRVSGSCVLSNSLSLPSLFVEVHKMEKNDCFYHFARLLGYALTDFLPFLFPISVSKLDEVCFT